MNREDGCVRSSPEVERISGEVQCWVNIGHLEPHPY
jgi:hypothetical protein